MSSNDVKSEIRNFFTVNLSIPADSVKDDTKLISTRIVDSIVALRLVSHLEEKFHIEFEAHEVNQDNLESIDRIAQFVQSKMK